MKLLIDSLYKHKTAKTICKIINIEGDVLDCVHPPDSYVFHYQKKLFEINFKEIKQ